MEEPFDPYLQWLAIRDPKRPPNHYRLLGIDLFESDVDVIQNAADRQMTHVRRFQGGKHAIESQRLLNELATAKICLLQPEKKAAYDAMLRLEGLTSPCPAMPPPVLVNVDAPAEVVLIPSKPLPLTSLEGNLSDSRRSTPKNKIVSLSWFLITLAAVLAILVGLFVLLSKASKKKAESLPASLAIQTEEKPHFSDKQ